MQRPFYQIPRFLSHPIILFLFSNWINTIYTSGEIYNPALVMERYEMEEPTYYSPYVNKYYDQYIELIVKEINPEIIVYGNSTTYEFRSWMFEPYTFYNFSNESTTLKAMEEFLDKITNTCQPRLIFFNLFPKDLGNDFIRKEKRSSAKSERPLKKIVDYFEIKPERFQHLQDSLPQFLGLKAKNKLMGRRLSDGSMFSNKLNLITKTQRELAHKRSNTLEFEHFRKKGVINRFKAEFDPEVYYKLQEIQKIANSKNIKLIFFTLPVINRMHEFLDENKDEYQLWKIINSKEFQEQMKRHDLIYFNFTDVTKEMKLDRLMRDRMHPSERLTAIILYKMVSGNQNLQKDLEKINLDELMLHTTKKPNFPLAELGN